MKFCWIDYSNSVQHPESTLTGQGVARNRRVKGTVGLSQLKIMNQHKMFCPRLELVHRVAIEIQWNVCVSSFLIIINNRTLSSAFSVAFL